MSRSHALALVALTACSSSNNPGGSGTPDSGAGGAAPERSATITAAMGGSVTSADGRLTVSIPPGALSADTTITIREPARSSWRIPYDEGEAPIGTLYELLPDGLTFTTPAELQLRVLPGDAYRHHFPLGAIAAFPVSSQSSSGAYERLQGTTAEYVGSGEVLVRAPIAHFSEAVVDCSFLSGAFLHTAVRAFVNETVTIDYGVSHSSCRGMGSRRMAELAKPATIDRIELRVEDPGVVAVLNPVIQGAGLPNAGVLQPELAGASSGGFVRAPVEVRCLRTGSSNVFADLFFTNGAGVKVKTDNPNVPFLRANVLCEERRLPPDQERVYRVIGVAPSQDPFLHFTQQLTGHWIDPEYLERRTEQEEDRRREDDRRSQMWAAAQATLEEQRQAEVRAAQERTRHSSNNVPPRHSDAPIVSVKSAIYRFDDDLADALFNDSAFECGETRADSSRIHTACTASPSRFPAGDVLAVGALLAKDLSLADPAYRYQVGFVFDADGVASNNFPAPPQFPNDFFQGTDKWYEVTYAPGSGWSLSVRDVRQGMREVASAARALLSPAGLMLVVPRSELGAAPSFRVTWFRHKGDFGQTPPYDWDGDLHPRPGAPLANVSTSVFTLPEALRAARPARADAGVSAPDGGTPSPDAGPADTGVPGPGRTVRECSALPADFPREDQGTNNVAIVCIESGGRCRVTNDTFEEGASSQCSGASRALNLGAGGSACATNSTSWTMAWASVEIRAGCAQVPESTDARVIVERISDRARFDVRFRRTGDSYRVASVQPHAGALPPLPALGVRYGCAETPRTFSAPRSGLIHGTVCIDSGTGACTLHGDVASTPERDECPGGGSALQLGFTQDGVSFIENSSPWSLASASHGMYIPSNAATDFPVDTDVTAEVSGLGHRVRVVFRVTASRTFVIQSAVKL